MLILTRRINEAVIIRDDVKITVLGINGHQVRIGVDAPRHVPVHREEVYNRIQRGEERPRKPNGKRDSGYFDSDDTRWNR